MNREMEEGPGEEKREARQRWARERKRRGRGLNEDVRTPMASVSPQKKSKLRVSQKPPLKLPHKGNYPHASLHELAHELPQPGNQKPSVITKTIQAEKSRIPTLLRSTPHPLVMRQPPKPSVSLFPRNQTLTNPNASHFTCSSSISVRHSIQMNSSTLIHSQHGTPRKI